MISGLYLETACGLKLKQNEAWLGKRVSNCCYALGVKAALGKFS